MIGYASTRFSAARRLGFNILTFGRNRKGSIAVMFAILLIPMIGAIGLAIDYSRFLKLRAQAQTAADGAALLAVNVAKKEINNDRNSFRHISQILNYAENRGSDFFDSYADKLSDGAMSADVSVVRDLSRVVARVTYRIEIDTTLGRVLGYNTMSGNASTDALTANPLNYDIYLYLDTSQSMGLGATAADMKNLYVATGNEIGPAHSCVFGCHVPEDNHVTKTNSSVARANGIRMRIDVLKDGVKNLVQEAKNGMENGEAVYRIGIRSFSDMPRDLIMMSDDMGLVANAANKIDLGPNRTPGFGDSQIDAHLRHLPHFPFFDEPSGDGLSTDQPKKFLFLITDGLNDRRPLWGEACPSGHCTAPVNTRWCDKIKRNGTTIGVIYTTYLPIEADPMRPGSGLDWRYNNLVRPIAAQIQPKLEQCASPGWFIEAKYESDIQDAFRKLFTQVTQPPTLVN